MKSETLTLENRYLAFFAFLVTPQLARGPGWRESHDEYCRRLASQASLEGQP